MDYIRHCALSPEIFLWGLTSGPRQRGQPALRAIPAAAIRIGVHWAGAYGKAATPTSQHKPRARKFPAPLQEYDGIWANASLLHLPKKELAEVVVKLEKALIQGGILFASFKYGDFEGIRDGRYYTDFTEETLRAFWEKETTMVIEDIWVTEDHMPEKREVQWVNMLARKAPRG